MGQLDLLRAIESTNADPAPDRAQAPARGKGTRLQPEVRPASSFVVFARSAGRSNASTGAAHWACRYADEVVEHVIALHAAGAPARQIARDLGIHRSTVRHWTKGRRRKPPMRLSICRRPLGFELHPLLGLADLKATQSDEKRIPNPQRATGYNELDQSDVSADESAPPVANHESAP